MALDATTRESNVRDSIRKFLVDNIKRTSGIALTFDTGMSSPKIQGNNAVDRWVAVHFGQFILGTVCNQFLSVVPCARNDFEGFKIAQMRDTIVGYLYPNGMRASITLYQSHPTNAWVKAGSMIPTVTSESGPLLASSEIKYKVIDVLLKWGAIYESHT